MITHAGTWLLPFISHSYSLDECLFESLFSAISSPREKQPNVEAGLASHLSLCGRPKPPDLPAPAAVGPAQGGADLAGEVDGMEDGMKAWRGEAGPGPGCQVLISSVFLSQAPKPPKGKE